jgi:signal transduction histidine kinase
MIRSKQIIGHCSEFVHHIGHIQTRTSLDLPLVRADSGRIIQVLTNVLGNAQQYTPSGGQVSARTWSEGRGVFVAVQDTGMGIPPEHLPAVFERFYRVDKSLCRAGGGSGFELTIARHLVEAHGGPIWAESPGANLRSIHGLHMLNGSHSRSRSMVSRIPGSLDLSWGFGYARGRSAQRNRRVEIRVSGPWT